MCCRCRRERSPRASPRRSRSCAKQSHRTRATSNSNPSVRVVKVPYVEDNSTQGGLTTPSEADVSRMIRAEVETWTPRRGPDWSDMMIRLAAAGPSPWVIYSVASAAMVLILVTAFVVGTWLQIGALAPQPIDTHVPH